jgi:superfamily II DNA/RNA helicase
VSSFADLGVPADLVAALALRSITEPTPVQEATLPDLLVGRDVCGKAPTGSGKTLAFGVPLVARLGRGRPGQPRALVLAPTRELAQQIRRELEPLAKERRRWVVAVHGGVSYDPQRRALRRGVDLLVACPGRLLDLVESGAVRLDRVDVVVVDEADRMADLGFLPDVQRILELCTARSQTVLFSATLDGDVDVLVRAHQSDPAVHDVTPPEAPIATSARHLFWRAEHHQKISLCAEAVAQASPAIVFCRTQAGVDRVAAELVGRGVRAVAAHGGLTQRARERALDALRQGRAAVLVATDVAARGIHVDGIACVIHFDPPDDAKAYVHRSGRTARAGAGGVVVSFVPRSGIGASRRMQRELALPGRVDLPDPSELVGTGSELVGTGKVPAMNSAGPGRLPGHAATRAGRGDHHRRGPRSPRP